MIVAGVLIVGALPRGLVVAAVPTLSASPNPAWAGAALTIEGTGFAKKQSGELLWDSTTILSKYRADGNGDFRVTVALPQAVAVGHHVIDAVSAPKRRVIATTSQELIATTSQEQIATPQLDEVEPTPTFTPAATPTTTPSAPPSPLATDSPVVTPSDAPSPSTTTAPSPTAPSPTPSAAPTAPATATPTATPSPVPQVDPSAGTPTHKAFAYYYMWWSRSHFVSKLGPNYPHDAVPLPLPATVDAGGCDPVSLYEDNRLVDVPSALYSQDDPGVIERDVRQAASAGLTGFLANWRGTGTADQTKASHTFNKRLDALVAAVNKVNAEGIPFKLWLNYRQSHEPTQSERVNDWAYLAREYASSLAIDRYDGRPVIVWNQTDDRTLAELQELSTRFRSTFFIIGSETRHTWSSERAAYLDGNTHYWSSQNPYTNPKSFDHLAELGSQVRAAGKLWVAPLAPGYNHILGGGTSCVPRNDGDTMRTLFEGNSRSAPDAWAVISWNEISENTHIQPLTRWKNRYLDVLHELLTGR